MLAVLGGEHPAAGRDEEVGGQAEPPFVPTGPGKYSRPRATSRTPLTTARTTVPRLAD
ncbi:hypothetical protein [Streptomyces djakartensis]|uniref:hypothetical protein n=1 Tax=Streptomyces djakartensis TaxID=68193 RepID=UPI00167C757C|nr:hypothetical protein [Streptomyces djakartensis]